MSVFDKAMAVDQLCCGLGVLEIPEGITELSGDFALVFDWMPEKMCQCSFREIRIPSTVQTINGIILTEYGPEQAPVKRFKKSLLQKIIRIIRILMASCFRRISSILFDILVESLGKHMRFRIR